MTRAILFLFLIPVVSWAQPSIESAITPNDGSGIVQISGSGFGDLGPRIHLYCDFQGTQPGSQVDSTGWIGAFTEITPGVLAGGDYQNPGALFVNGGELFQGIVEFEGTTEIFVSYSLEIPFGHLMPGAVAEGQLPEPPGDTEDHQSFPMAWLLNGPGGFLGAGDVRIPVCYNYGLVLNNFSTILSCHLPGEGDTDSFSFLGKNRMSLYLNAGELPRVGPADINFEMINSEFGATVYQNDSDWALFSEEDYGVPSHWTRVVFPGGFMRDPEDVDVAALYDDIYIATGPGARARMEIGDSPDFEACLQREIMIVNSWADDFVSATIPTNKFEVGEQVYVFVVDAQGEVSGGEEVEVPQMGPGVVNIDGFTPR